MNHPSEPGRGKRSPAGLLRSSFFLASLLALMPAAAGAATWVVPGFSDTAVVPGLSQPTDFTWTPDGRMVIIERAGYVRVLVGGVLQEALNHSAVTDDGPSEAGFLGIVLHPNFATTGELYIYYTRTGHCPIAASPNRCNRISKFTMTGNTIAAGSEVVILNNISAANGNHNGATILIGPDGKLWAAPGDSGTGGCKAQNLTPGLEGSFSGKVLRMELDGSPAAGNPFLGDATKEPRIFAYGFRNPFRFSFRPSNGALFAGDVGEGTREEIDAVTTPGGNYGWPTFEGTFDPPGNPPCPSAGIPPVHDYPRSVGGSITGGVFAPSGYGSTTDAYVFGDFVSNTIKFLQVAASNTAVGGHQDLATNAGGPVSFKTGPDGMLYYAGYFTGQIIRINPPPPANFHTVTPCRAVDTRNANGPLGGPAIAANTTRTFTLAGQCGIPATARAVSVNVTAAEGSFAGHLRVHPGGSPTPATSMLNFNAGQARANNALATLGGTGSLSVHAGMIGGSVHVIIDVNGYLE